MAKKAKSRTRRVQLPCCQEDVLVTGRRSKISERPRRHQCRKCGTVYAIGADSQPKAVS
jgi:hypothetical protein